MWSFHQFESSVENRWVAGVEGSLSASVGIQGGELSLLPVEVKAQASRKVSTDTQWEPCYLLTGMKSLAPYLAFSDSPPTREGRGGESDVREITGEQGESGSDKNKD